MFLKFASTSGMSFDFYGGDSWAQKAGWMLIDIPNKLSWS
jgi:hypothetical protein